MSNRSVLLISLFACCIAVPADACGPSFPNTIIHTRKPMLQAPPGPFKAAVLKIKLESPVHFKATITGNNPWHKTARSTCKQDLSDANAAIGEQALSPATATQACQAYAHARQAIETYLDAPREQRPAMADPVLPSGVPAEFRLYLSGAIKWHRGEHAAARKDWRALLALSADQRQWRSTWAAFMLAKSAETPADRIAGYRHVRELAAEGFKDSLGLAATSLGDEAAVELYECRQPAKALRLYLQQVHTGERWADVSLAMTASRVLSNNHKELAALVKDKVVLDVLTAYCASTGHYGVLRWSWNSDERTIAKSKTRSNLHALLKAIEVAGIERVAHAGEIAWGAYRLGDYETAAAWAKRAGKDPRGTWIRAKLLLREGKQADAAEALARVVKTFPCNEVWTCPDNSARTPGDRGLMSPRSRAAGELAVLKLCRQQYVDALDLLARHGWWADAAFVAERVLTADELKAYVQTAWPEMVTSPDRWKDLSEDHARRKARTARNLRHLLARRLTRIGRWKEARPFYPPKHRETLDAYIQAIRRGHDSSLTNAERAEQFMTAARMARSKGKVLLATEESPDNGIDGGFGASVEEENDPNHKPAYYNRPERIGTFLPVSLDAHQRVMRHVPTPNRRYHYWYTAAEHAWSAAELMPDGSKETAHILWQGGRWVMYRHPDYADKFYKALVRRCGNTLLGQEADRRRWFPRKWPKDTP